jgi:hypothetical protein
MITLISEVAGDSLQGAINGANRIFTVTYDYNPDKVQVFHNGRLKIQNLDDGYDLYPPRSVRMREPPETGDTVEVQYQANVSTGGGALGGVPEAPVVTQLAPSIDGHSNEPQVSGEDLKPVATSHDDRPGLLSEDMVPVLIISQE